LAKNRILVTIYYLLYFSGKAGHATSFAGAVNAPNVHQISPNMHDNDPLMFLYSSGSGSGLNMPTQTAFSADLTVHHTYFEPTVGIHSNRIKG